MFDQNWLKVFVNRIKSKTAETCTLKNATSYFAIEEKCTILNNEVENSLSDEFLSEPDVEIIEN